jgi:hypothetical protein
VHTFLRRPSDRLGADGRDHGAVDSRDFDAANWIYRTAAGLLLALAAPAATGARTPIIWFKICRCYPVRAPRC